MNYIFRFIQNTLQSDFAYRFLNGTPTKFNYRFLDNTHLPSTSGGSGGGGGAIANLAIAAPFVNPISNDLHAFVTTITYTGTNTTDSMLQVLLDGQTVVSQQIINAPIPNSPVNASFSNITSVENKVYTFRVVIGSLSAEVNYTSPAPTGGGGGGGGQPPANGLTIAPLVTVNNTLPLVGVNESKLSTSRGKHIDRVINQSLTPTYQSDPILQFAKDVRYFFLMADAYPNVAGATPATQNPAVDLTGATFPRWHVDALIRVKDWESKGYRITMTMVKFPAQFPNAFWTATEMGADSATRIANSKKFWDGFLFLYDRTTASEGKVLVEEVEFSNEAWGNSVGVDALRDWIDGAYQAWEGFYNSSNPNNWRIRLNSGALQAYATGTNGRWGAPDYIGNLLRSTDYAKLGAIGVHNYSFTINTLDLVRQPEDPNSEFGYFETMLNFLSTNNRTNPIQITETGWDSDVVGQVAQGAYLLRGLIWSGSNPKVEKYVIYEDVDNPSTAVGGLYGTSGLLLSTGGLNRYQGGPKQAFKMFLQFKNVVGESVVVRFVKGTTYCAAIMEAPTQLFLVLWKIESLNGVTVQNIAVEDVLINNQELGGYRYGNGYLINGEGLNLNSQLVSTSKGTIIDPITTPNKQGTGTTITLKMSPVPIVYEITGTIA